MEDIGEITDQHKKLLISHKQKADAVSKAIKSNFTVALSEAGILHK